MTELFTRDEFREGVLARDGGKCVVCKAPAKDAHHIVERRLWSDEGYYLENGASLCADHHLEAEMTVLSCEEIRTAAGIKRILLPNHFDSDETYDKWGNVIGSDGIRYKGELFDDPSVYAILKAGGVLEDFDVYVKFPKIWHLPWSDGVDLKTDRLFTPGDIEANFDNEEVVVTEKLDGENTSCYSDYLHARSIDGRSHPSRDWMKALHASFGHDIPVGWRVCGENVFAKHSIEYDGLPSFFLVFAIYNDTNMCLSWDQTLEWAALLGLETVPLRYRGKYDEAKVRACFTGKSVFGSSLQEGYVMRVARGITWGGHRQGFGKFVRADHVKTAHNWMYQQVVPNKLKPKGP